MFSKTNEKGQALILITLAAVVLFAFAALAIDGSRVYSDKRHAQNAADSAALAGALKYAREGATDTVITTKARAVALSNGYAHDPASGNPVNVTFANYAGCPDGAPGKEITVEVVNHLDTTLARVIGRNEFEVKSTAVTRACKSHSGSPFPGQAVVTLCKNCKGFDATGNSKSYISGGGIFANSTSSSAVECGGAAKITAPTINVVGGVNISGCSTLTGPSPNLDTNATQLNYSDYSALFPDPPACDGTATPSGGQWHPEAGKDGSRVALSGSMDFAPGLYCITNSPGSYHGNLTGSGVTFTVTSTNLSFDIKFNGHGTITATAPTSGDYEGLLFFLPPKFDGSGNLLQTQTIDIRGNGNANVVGTIYAPSMEFYPSANSETHALKTQLIVYNVSTAGGGDQWITYDPNNTYQPARPGDLTLWE